MLNDQKSIFGPALYEMMQSGLPYWGPRSFKTYLDRNHLTIPRSVAEFISINSYHNLDPVLRSEEVMVFRLGRSSEGTSTQCALVHSPGHLNDFFLFDHEILACCNDRHFHAADDEFELYPFRLLSSLSETALVNYAFASGILKTALGIETRFVTALATGALTATFPVRPYSRVDFEATHQSGQIQIDGLFVAEHAGRETMYVIEAKAGTGYNSLSKHKLVYPLNALALGVPPSMELVPVYIRIVKELDFFHFLICECSYPDPRKGIEGIDRLEIKKATRFAIPTHAFSLSSG